MGKKMTALATALLAASIAAPACAPFDARVRRLADQLIDRHTPRLVDKTLNKREARTQQALDELLEKNVYCVRNRVSYEPATPTAADLAGRGSMPVAFDSPDGFTYIRLDEKTIPFLKESSSSVPSKRKTFGTYGSSFVYMTKDGHSYLTTNAHVVKAPEKVWYMQMKGTTVSVSLLKLADQKLTLVDNIRDSYRADDVPVRLVKKDPSKDMAVIETRRPLAVSERYVFDEGFRAKVGETVYILGLPRARMKTVHKGVVAHPSKVVGSGERWDFLDVTSTFGNSGSSYFVERKGRLYLAGTVGRIWTYPRSMSTMLSIGYPLKEYSPMLAVGGGAKR